MPNNPPKKKLSVLKAEGELMRWTGMPNIRHYVVPIQQLP
jgi:hypothetical protein